MKILQSDYRQIMDFLVKERWEGNEFAAFLRDSYATGKEDIFCFETPYQAKEFCYEMSTDRDTYDYLGIRSAYRAMSEALEDKSLLIKTDGLVDISAMVAARLQRLDEGQNVNNKKNYIMNEKNFEYLRDQVKLTGFGESLEYELKEKMKQQADKFEITFAKEYGKNKVEATLNFKKSEQGDMYFFNTYDLRLNKDTPDMARQQTFFINNNKSTITMKEAYNLLDGRSVFKELKTKDGQDYSAWVKIDFKQSDEKGNFKQVQFGERYGYDLEAELKKHPIKELANDAYKEDLIGSLKKGNLQSATFIKDGQEVKQYVEANPQYKNINLYDSAMQRLDRGRSQSENQSEAQGQSAKETAKKGQVDTEDADGKEKKKKGQRI